MAIIKSQAWENICVLETTFLYTAKKRKDMFTVTSQGKRNMFTFPAQIGDMLFSPRMRAKFYFYNLESFTNPTGTCYFFCDILAKYDIINIQSIKLNNYVSIRRLVFSHRP